MTKNRLLTLAAALTLLFVLGHFYAKPLFAQVRAALIKNIDERARTPYQKTFDCNAGPNSPICFTSLPMVEPNNRLVLEYVSFSASCSTQPFVVLRGGIGSQNEWFFNSLRVPLTPLTLWTVAQPMTAFVEAGQSPQLTMQTSTLGCNIQGTVSGYLVDLSQ